MPVRPVVVLAEDLIWRQRLSDALRRIGADVAPTTATPEPGVALEAEAAIVDLTAHRTDPIEAIERFRAAGVPVLAVGPHDDQPLRRRALDAGADRVLAYRKVFEDGPATLGAWLDRVRRAPAT